MAQLSTLSLASDSALKAYYPLANVNDSKGSNNLTNNNSVAFDSAGEYGNGANGGSTNTNKYLSTNTLWLNQTELAASWSVAFWLKMNVMPVSLVALVSENAYDGSQNKNFDVYIDNNGKLNFQGYVASNGTTFSALNPNTIATTVEHHVAVTWTSGAQKLYVDGMLVASDTQLGWGSDPNNYHNPVISSILSNNNPGVEFADAVISDLCIFTKVLSSTEVNSLASNTSPSSSISPSISPSASRSPSASASPSASVSSSISPSASKSPSASRSPSSSISASPSPSIPVSNFTKQAVALLPTTKSDLSTVYTPSEDTSVATDDGNRAEIEGIPPIYLIHQFKQQHNNNHDTINVDVVVQCTKSPETNPVYLQIWNVNTSAWETIATDSTSEANENFHLSGIVSTNLSNYFDELVDLHFPADIYQTNEITVRVYQQISS